VTGPDRDRSTDALLKRALGSPARNAPGESCLDVETIAAWIDRGLDDAARATATEHAAGCARCQALLATLTKTTTAAPSAVPWWSGMSARWLVPLTAAAAAVTLWVVVPGQRTQPPVQSTIADRQTAPAPNPRSEDLPSAIAEREFARAVEAPRSTIDRTDAGKRSQPPSEADVRSAESRQEALGRLAAADLQKEQVGGGALAEPRPEVKAEELQERQTAAALQAKRADEAGARDRAAIAPAAPPAAIPATAAAPAAMGRVSPMVRTIEIASPDPNVRWRISGATIELTLSGGTRWEPTTSGVTGELVAGGSPSREVCWIVGRQGLVLRTVDGRQWSRVRFPDAVDLAAVQATSAEVAAVTTTDGRVFRTLDGGTTWTLRP
jgi:hypothetical protein